MSHGTGLEQLELEVAASLGHRSGLLHGGRRFGSFHSCRNAHLPFLLQQVLGADWQIARGGQPPGERFDWS